MQEIIAAIDFSRFTPAVLSHSVQLAMEYNARLTLFHSWFDPIIESPGSMSVFDFGVSAELTLEVRERIESKATAEMEEIESQLLSEFPNLNLRIVLRGGRPEKELRTELVKLPYNLLIMGLRGAGNTRRAIIGSVTAEVMEACPVPLLCVPPDARSLQLERVGFATNFIHSDRQAYENLKTLFGSRIKLVMVVHVKLSKSTLQPEQLETLQWFSDMKSPVELVMSGGEGFTEGIDYFIQSWEIQLLVMTHAHRGVIHRLFDTGRTREVYFESRIPLLVISR